MIIIMIYLLFTVFIYFNVMFTFLKSKYAMDSNSNTRGSVHIRTLSKVVAKRMNPKLTVHIYTLHHNMIGSKYIILASDQGPDL